MIILFVNISALCLPTRASSAAATSPAATSCWRPRAGTRWTGPSCRCTRQTPPSLPPLLRSPAQITATKLPRWTQKKRRRRLLSKASPVLVLRGARRRSARVLRAFSSRTRTLTTRCPRTMRSSTRRRTRPRIVKKSSILIPVTMKVIATVMKIFLIFKYN